MYEIMQIDLKNFMQKKHVYFKANTCSLGELDEKKSYQNLTSLKFLTKWLQGKYSFFILIC